MNKKIMVLIILALLLIFSIGMYALISYTTEPITDNNSSLANNSTDINSNLSTNESKTDSNTTTKNTNDINKNDKKNKAKNNKIVPKIKTITSKADVIKEANKILNEHRKFYGKNAVVKNVEVNRYGLWFVDFVDSKTGKKVGETIISDETGKIVEAD
ncbi:hypothetical protein [Methanobrevibacter curvatus]|uniref:PepSY domain-containing protein n=1 Tax=Methanobrevibacter curvatus TaxID=49547 RepID=A0A166DSF0_9EURY|nr:hypothetical protein [Methanobrevibacter curvatus]KZX15904.1 hypothetical protein MBCUR_01810 [Methanobrevibacter curvatus]